MNLDVEEDLQNTLKECPFCRGDAELTQATECFGHGDYVRMHCVRCKQCGARGPKRDEYDEPRGHAVENAINAWNTRKAK